MRNRANQQKNKVSGFVTVHANECGDNADRMIRKFIKKVKKEGFHRTVEIRSRRRTRRRIDPEEGREEGPDKGREEWRG